MAFRQPLRLPAALLAHLCRRLHGGFRRPCSRPGHARHGNARRRLSRRRERDLPHVQPGERASAGALRGGELRGIGREHPSASRAASRPSACRRPMSLMPPFTAKVPSPPRGPIRSCVCLSRSIRKRSRSSRAPIPAYRASRICRVNGSASGKPARDTPLPATSSSVSTAGRSPMPRKAARAWTRRTEPGALQQQGRCHHF